MRGMAFAIAAFAASAALAQPYPSKPIRLVNPFPPGSATDLIARAVGNKFSESVSQPVIVDNRAGAGGVIGSELVARAPADGYTLLLANGQTHVLSAFLMKHLPYDPQKDFTPITSVAVIVIALVVNPSVPARTVRELIAYAKANPGKLSYGTPGIGSPHQLAGEMLKMNAGIDMAHVPYKGGAPAMSDLVAGQIPVAVATLSTAVPFAKSGKVRLLAVIKPERDATAPDVPSINETLSGVGSPVNFIGFFGPAGLSPQILARLNAELVKAVNAPEVRSTLEKAGMTVKTSTPEAFAAEISAQTAEAARAIQAAGIQPE